MSFSSMSLFEMSREKWANQYLFGKKQRISRNMAYGSMLASGMEHDKLSGDPILDLMMVKLPRYDLADKIVEDKNGVEVLYKHDGKTYKVPYMTDKKEKIPLLAKPDTMSFDGLKFAEYKTSVRNWTQKMVDESGQLTFYATAIWLKTKKIPHDIKLINVVVNYGEGGALSPTGEILTFETKRTMTDILKMTARIRRNWKEIKKFCEEELI